MTQSKPNSFRTGPDAQGHFGLFGGRYVAETLMPLILDLEKAYGAAKKDPSFQAELDSFLEHYVGRPSPLYFAERLTEHFGGPKIYFKRDELNHTGAHKINNCMGQILLARRMGKKRIIAETGAGQHGVATATAAARFGLPCVVYMGEEDIKRQSPNVFRRQKWLELKQFNNAETMERVNRRRSDSPFLMLCKSFFFRHSTFFILGGFCHTLY